MAERTQKVVGGKIVPRQPKVSEEAPALPEAAVAWTGTSLSAALANAQAEESSATQAQSEGGSDAETRHPAPAKRPTRTGPAGGASLKAKHAFAATRAVARKLALQAIYRWLLNDAPWQDLVKEFGEAEDMPNADPQYFRALVEGVWGTRKSLDERLAGLVDRPVEQLDPVEHAVLLVGLFELSARPDVPYRVAINEAVGLAKRFGATDGHKFVNAVLDRAARTLRPGEN
jgi:transcription antitermination protein NusB